MSSTSPKSQDQGLMIYIHWPFCEKKCPYCDFFSEVKAADQDCIIEKYLKDLDFYKTMTKGQEVSSIFFGGGTPSLLKAQNIEKLINRIHKNWKISQNIEISLEANPNSLKVADIRSAGINRLSLGVQALNDKDLKFLGRIHNTKQAYQAISDVLSSFDNHSIDLIYARPEQTLEAWRKELAKAASFGFKHLSLYQLTIEEGTIFYKMGIESMEEDKALELYNFTQSFLEEKGYFKYEVSNFAQKGFASKHNLGYWQGKDYIGIGNAAHGRLRHNGKIFATTHPRQLEELSAEDRATELLLMGLRINEGINKQNFQNQCGLSLNDFINSIKLQELKDLKLVHETADTLFVTPLGFPVLNKIIEDLSS